MKATVKEYPVEESSIVSPQQAVEMMKGKAKTD